MKRGSKIGMKGENLRVSNVRNNRFKNCRMNTEKEQSGKRTQGRYKLKANKRFRYKSVHSKW